MYDARTPAVLAGNIGSFTFSRVCLPGAPWIRART